MTMPEFLQGNEPLIRIGLFFVIIAAMTIWEIWAPRRRQDISRLVRWPNNLGVVAINTILLRFILPTGAVGFALLSQANGWGLLNALDLPWQVSIIASVIALDLAIYLQHVLFHAVPALWRLHRMHHTDLEFDVTTGLRFHPVEILLSMAIKLAAVAALGPPAVAVLIFEVVLNATAMFNHGNVHIPMGIDHTLRWLVVTPDMHRVHHSVRPNETNSNFGFNLPWWDRLLGTYQAQPAAGHEKMVIGVEQFRSTRDLWIDRMLIQPACGPAATYPINRQKEIKTQ